MLGDNLKLQSKIAFWKQLEARQLNESIICLSQIMAIKK